MIRAPPTPSSRAIAKVSKLIVAEVMGRPSATAPATVATTPIPRCPTSKWPATTPMHRVSGTVGGEPSDQVAIYTFNFYSSQKTAQQTALLTMPKCRLALRYNIVITELDQ